MKRLLVGKAICTAFFGALLPLVGMGFVRPALAQTAPFAPYIPLPSPAVRSSAKNVPMVVLPFTLQFDQIWVSVSMTQAGPGEKYRVPNDARPFTLALDTGADTLFLAEEAFAARHITLPPPEKDSRISIGGLGDAGDISARSVSGIEMMLGPILLQGKPWVASVKPLVQAGVDGTLGAEVFRSCVVEIDYNKKTVRLFSPETFTPPAPDDGFISLPIRFVGDWQRPVIAVDVTPFGFSKTTASLRIDTGASGTISFNAPFVKRNGWQAFAPKTVPSSAVGLNGVTNERAGRLKQVTLGGITLARPYAYFSFNTKGMMTTEESDGIIGGEVLRRFTVILDYSRSTMYLRPNPQKLSEPFPYDYAGFKPAMESTKFGWPIASVDADSPAARAGIKKGDFIVAIDKHPVAQLTFIAFHNLFDDSKSGPFVLTLSDAKGEKKRDVRVVPVAL